MPPTYHYHDRPIGGDTPLYLIDGDIHHPKGFRATGFKITCAFCDGCADAEYHNTITYDACLDVVIARDCTPCGKMVSARFRFYGSHWGFYREGRWLMVKPKPSFWEWLKKLFFPK